MRRSCSTSRSRASVFRPVVRPPNKAGLHVFNRVTGEPVWPIEEKPVPQSLVPGEKTWPTQPHPDLAAPIRDAERHARRADRLTRPSCGRRRSRCSSSISTGRSSCRRSIAATPLASVRRFIARAATVGLNIPRRRGRGSGDGRALRVVAEELLGAQSGARTGDRAKDPGPIGKTVMDWVSGPGVGPAIDGLPAVEAALQPHHRHRFEQRRASLDGPVGETPAQISNHAALKGLDIGNWGNGAHPNQIMTRTLMMYGAGRGGRAGASTRTTRRRAHAWAPSSCRGPRTRRR
jgi:hypothetical protein